MQVPLVTIGIPTYNRALGLERAARSALEQTHQDLEVLISDDASPDSRVAATTDWLRRQDARIRAVRQPRNLGHAANYQWLLDTARGDYFMWLADDDWLDPEYVERCLDAVVGEPPTVLACGQPLYYHDGRLVSSERRFDLTAHSPARRLVGYFTRVSVNGALFGVARRQDLLRVGFPPTIGGDWLLVAQLVARGPIRMLTEVHIHRSLEGLGSDPHALARSFGVGGPAVRSHHLLVAGTIARQLAVGTGSFAALALPARLMVAATAATSLLLRFTLADAVRRVLGPRFSAAAERKVSAWLR